MSFWQEVLLVLLTGVVSGGSTAALTRESLALHTHRIGVRTRCIRVVQDEVIGPTEAVARLLDRDASAAGTPFSIERYLATEMLSVIESDMRQLSLRERHAYWRLRRAAAQANVQEDLAGESVMDARLNLELFGLKATMFRRLLERRFSGHVARIWLFVRDLCVKQYRTVLIRLQRRR